MLSPHDPNIVWYGGNRLFKSYNRGDTWAASEDLTKNIDRRTVAVMGVPGDKTMLSKADGIVNYSTIIAVNESPVMPGVVWAGTDDGNLQVSRDGGVTFTEVGKNIPGLPANNPYWISRIDASHFDAGHGVRRRWTGTAATISSRTCSSRTISARPFRASPATCRRTGNVQVIREDPKNKDLLYVGTEFGLFVSLDGGKTWQKFMNNYPTVRTDDILIHPRDNDLIVATHGRSIWIADDITALQQFTPAVAASGRVSVRHSSRDQLHARRHRKLQDRWPARLVGAERAERHGDQLLPQGSVDERGDADGDRCLRNYGGRGQVVVAVAVVVLVAAPGCGRGCRTRWNRKRRCAYRLVATQRSRQS